MVRLFLLMMVVTGVCYFLVSIYLRSLRTEKLEQLWDREKPPGVERETFVADGLRAYDRSFRRKLVWLVLVVPFLAVLVAIWVQNYTGYR